MKVLITAIIFLSLVAGMDCSRTSKKLVDKSQITQQINKAIKQGTVVNAINGGGYTYIQLENQGVKFWVATSVTNVRRGMTISWENASLMRDFTSSALRRKFDKIYFISDANINTNS